MSLLHSDRKLANSWLIFGSDDGEVRLMTERIVKKVKTSETEVMKVENDLSVMRAQSLFHTSRVIIVCNATDGVTDAVKNSMQYIHEHDYLIVQGGDLKKNSKLRELFEDSNESLALHCYKLNEDAITMVIEKELRQRNIAFDKDIPQMLSSYVSSDSYILQNEINKISLFFADSIEKKLTVSLLNDIVSMNSEASLDQLFTKILLHKDFSHEMEKAISQMSTIFVIRAYQNFLLRILFVQKQLGKIGIESAMNQLKPPLFGKQKSDFMNVVRNSKFNVNKKLLLGAIQIECDLKSMSGIDSTQILFQQIMEQIWNVR